MDIGYFRLCSYLFPFEKTYPKLKNRNHEFKAGTQFEDAVTLYYLDFDLRTILFKYITRIEVAFRTYVTYTLSNKYIQSPTWFVDPKYIDNSFITKFELDLYNEIRKNPVIKRGHPECPGDRKWLLFCKLKSPLIASSDKGCFVFTLKDFGSNNKLSEPSFQSHLLYHVLHSVAEEVSVAHMIEAQSGI